ncbi:MAG: hypothetical protein HYV32_02755 [Candidatus Kerfeldbacteria bacterium]|nr:hypothetical protein [Candidatus Kerfeldbacteria bacterium]
MKLFYSLIATLCIAGWLFPASAFAEVNVDLVSGGDTLTLTEDPQEQEQGSTTYIFSYYTSDSVGTTYDLVYDTHGFVPVVMVTIGSMTGWEYDAETSLLTAHVSSADLSAVLPEGQVPEGINIIMLAMAEAAEEGQDGPPNEAAGMYMATNLMQWEMIPPSEGNMQFGFRLSGSEGTTGFFDFFVPNALIDFLGTTKEDLVLFEDDDQRSISLTDTGDGALFRIQTQFTEETVADTDAIQTTAEDDTTTITKTFAAGEAQPLSLGANKERVEAGTKVRLYGWLHNGKKGKRIVLMKKNAEGKFQKFKILKTKKNGRFDTLVKMGSDDASFRAVLKKANDNKTQSPIKDITVID